VRLTRLASATVILLAGLEAAPVNARSLPPAGWETTRVGVLPIGFYGRSADDLFDERPAVRRARELAGRWHRAIEDGLGHRDQVEVLRVGQIRDRIARTPDYRRAVQVATRAHELGVRAFENLQAEDALFHFDSAREVYESAYADLVVPIEVADTAFYRGLVLVEQGDPSRAHVAFRDVLILDPARRFDRGYYPAATERAVAGAQADLNAQPDLFALRHAPARLDALSDHLGLDALLVAHVDGDPDDPILHLALYDRRTRAFTHRQRIGLDDEADATERLDRALSGWHTCALQARQDLPPWRPDRRRWFLDIGYTHGLWLTHRRTRDIVQSVGGQITLAFEPSESFQVYARAAQLATLPDANGDLLDVFVTTRFGVGAGLSLGPERVRFFARTGLDLGIALSDVRMTNDVNCKHFGADHPRCERIFTADAPAVWFGLDFSLGVRVALSAGWFIAFTSGVTSYIFDPSVTSDLNFPWNASLAVGAPF